MTSLEATLKRNITAPDIIPTTTGKKIYGNSFVFICDVFIACILFFLFGFVFAYSKPAALYCSTKNIDCKYI